MKQSEAEKLKSLLEGTSCKGLKGLANILGITEAELVAKTEDKQLFTTTEAFITADYIGIKAATKYFFV